jgi:potassium efflux system protein
MRQLSKDEEARQEAKQESKPRDTNEPAQDGDAAEVQVDLKALSDTTRELINTAVMLSGLIGLRVIWSEVLPALRVWEEVTLWHQTVTLDGEEKVNPITLADIALAVVYGAVTFVLAKNLPAVLEILFLQYTTMSAGLRYPTISALNEAINDKLNAAGISIAFPQRDLHLDTARPLQVELRRVDD